MRRHDAGHNLRSAKSFFQTVRRCHALRNLLPGKKEQIHPVGGNGFVDFLFIRPEPNIVSAFPSQDDCESSAPGASADYGDLAHPRLN